jgi:hypothetical protein
MANIEAHTAIFNAERKYNDANNDLTIAKLNLEHIETQYNSQKDQHKKLVEEFKELGVIAEKEAQKNPVASFWKKLNPSDIAYKFDGEKPTISQKEAISNKDNTEKEFIKKLFDMTLELNSNKALNTEQALKQLDMKINIADEAVIEANKIFEPFKIEYSKQWTPIKSTGYTEAQNTLTTKQNELSKWQNFDTDIKQLSTIVNAWDKLSKKIGELDDNQKSIKTHEEKHFNAKNDLTIKQEQHDLVHKELTEVKNKYADVLGDNHSSHFDMGGNENHEVVNNLVVQPLHLQELHTDNVINNIIN